MPLKTVQARDSASGWLEARKIKSASAEHTAMFIWEDIICRHGVPQEVVIDYGPEMRTELRRFLKKYGVNVTSISAYHPQSNGSVERAMRTMKDALSKLTDGYTENGPNRVGRISWTSKLHLAVLADRVTLHAHTGISPFRFVYGFDAVLPIELDVPTWTTLPWETVDNRVDLIVMRARQIEQRDKDVEDGLLRLERLRTQNQQYLDERRVLRTSPLRERELVLLHDTRLEDDLTAANKLRFRWTGPYRITRDFGNGSYELSELDGTTYRQMNPDSTAINGNRLKRFHYRALWENPPDLTVERLNLDDANLPQPRRRRLGRPPRDAG
jgi:hypothetical protein